MVRFIWGRYLFSLCTALDLIFTLSRTFELKLGLTVTLLHLNFSPSQQTKNCSAVVRETEFFFSFSVLNVCFTPGTTSSDVVMIQCLCDESSFLSISSNAICAQNVAIQIDLVALQCIVIACMCFSFFTLFFGLLQALRLLFLMHSLRFSLTRPRNNKQKWSICVHNFYVQTE